MQKFVVLPEEKGKRLVRILTQRYPNIPVYRFQKALKNRDLRVEGQRVREDVLLQEGQEISVYLPDMLFQNTEKSEHPKLERIYEDRNIIILNKPQGMTVHPGKGTEIGTTLIELLRKEEQNEQLNLLHRLDRNTGGLVLLAKTHVALGKLNDCLQKGNLIKRYRCLVRGIPEIGEMVSSEDGDCFYETLAYWEKPHYGDEVYVHAEPHEKDLPMITRYRVLRVFTDLVPNEVVSELEVELVTGRTHQIRAHLAFLGHPILGDGKYGRNSFNLLFRTPKGSKLQRQQLFATSLHFGTPLPDGLQSLRKKVFRIEPSYTLQL